VFKTKKGLNLPISGNPSSDVDSSTAVNSIGILGADYVGLKPTMMVDEGDTVLSGQKLFENKKKSRHLHYISIIWSCQIYK
jgi:Na+-transporting NADH:ubiquinone oxidoreductase subunit A